MPLNLRVPHWRESMADIATAFLVGLVWGTGIGYAICRRVLHLLTLNEVGPYRTARIFGYPPPKDEVEEKHG